MWPFAGRLLGGMLVLGLAACNPNGGVGYVEIKTVPATSTPPRSISIRRSSNRSGTELPCCAKSRHQQAPG